MTVPGIASRFGEAVAQGSLGTAVRESVWAYPAVETIHIVGFALLVGSIVVVDLRLLGLRRNVALAPLLFFVLPVTLLSLVLVVPTGILLFAAHADDLVRNPAFVAKLALLLCAALNAALFHAGPYRREIDAPSGTATRRSTRLFAATSIVVWVSVLVAGRLIAYV